MSLKPKSEFSKNVLTLMTGTTIAQAIPIAISPILTRIYTPEDFGILALYMAIVSFISIIITARYEMAVVLPKSDEEAINIVALSLLITLTLVTAVSLVILIYKDELLHLFHIESVGNLLYLVPLSLFLAGIIQTFTYWSNRKEYFQTMSSSQIAQSVSIGSFQPLFGYLSVNGGLIFGNIVGRMFGAFFFVSKFIKTDREILRSIEVRSIRKQMKKYKDFPLVNSLHAFSDILRTSGAVMLISTFFGTAVLGFYALSLRVLQVPIGIVGSALGQVLYRKFSHLHNEEEALYPHVKKVMFRLLLIAIPAFTILFFIAPDLFSFVFGQEWRVAGEYSQILIPYLFMNFLLSPISQIPIILGKQKEIFYISLFGNVSYLGIIALFHSLSITYLLGLLSLFMVLYYTYVFYWFYKRLQ